MSERNAKFLWQDEFTCRGPKKPVTYRVGIAMSNKDNGDGRGFFASAEEMVRATPYTLRPVKAAIADLMEGGWIERTRKGGRSGDGSQWSSEYRLVVPSQGAGSSTLRLGQGAGSKRQGAQSSTPLDPAPLDPPTPHFHRPSDLSDGDKEAPDTATPAGPLAEEPLSPQDPAAEVEPVEKKPCGCTPGVSCPTCRGDVVRPQKHPDFKLKGRHDDHLERDEKLNEYGEPLGLDY